MTTPINAAVLRVAPRGYPRGSAQHGFSLLELIVYIAILAIVLVIFTGTFLSLNRGQGQVQARSEVNAALRFATEKIAQDIRSASAVTVPALAGTSSSTLALTVSGATTTYCIAAGQLRRATGGATCGSSAEAVTGVSIRFSTSTFTRFENTNTILGKTIVSIQAQLSASYNSSSTDWQYVESKTMTMSLR